MKAANVWKVLLILIMLVVVPMALADKPGPKYDPAAETTFKGTVDEVKQFQSGDQTDVHLMIKTDKGLVEVCLCPAKFLSDMDVNFQKGDQLEVTGAKAKEEDGRDVVLAKEIVKGENTLVLRDKNGGPVWTWLMKK